MPHAESATITSQVQFQIAKFKFRQYQNITFFRHFAKFNAQQIFTLYGKSWAIQSTWKRMHLLPIPDSPLDQSHSAAAETTLLGNRVDEHMYLVLRQLHATQVRC